MSDEELNNPSTTVPESSGEQSEGVENVAEAKAIKDILGEAIGRNFKSDEDAIKSVRETFSYVGKAGQIEKNYNDLIKQINMDNEQNNGVQVTPVAEQPNVDFSSEIKKVEEKFSEELFYSKNSQYEPYREVLTALKTQHGKSLSEVVQLDSFNNLYEAAEAKAQADKNKTVLESNSRLGQVVDKFTEAKELMDKNPEAAKDMATKAVIDIYNIK
jgi:hypothetical protein